MSTLVPSSSQAQLVRVPFRGEAIPALQVGKDVWVPLRPLCERFGVDFSSQLAKLKKLAWATVVEIPLVAQDGATRAMACLHLRSFAGWLLTIKEGKVRVEVREALRSYQEEAADALYEHFLGGVVVAPSTPPTTESLSAMEAKAARLQAELWQLKADLARQRRLERRLAPAALPANQAAPVLAALADGAWHRFSALARATGMANKPLYAALQGLTAERRVEQAKGPVFRLRPLS